MKKESVFGMDFEMSRPKLKKSKSFFSNLERMEEESESTVLSSKKENADVVVLPIGKQNKNFNKQ